MTYLQLTSKVTYRSHTCKQRGFTLVELSIVLVILSSMMYVGVSMANLQRMVAVSQATERNLATVARSLQQFQLTHGRYPCPALFTHANTHAEYGVERDSTAACSGAHFVANGAYIGFVPFRTLGIDEKLAYDGWDRRMMYVISTGHTTSSTYLNGTVALVATEINHPTITSIQRGAAIFALISHGPGGHGAYNRSGSLIKPCTTGTLDSRNCTMPPAGVPLFPIVTDRNMDVPPTSTAFYDDYVVWRGQERIVPPQRAKIEHPHHHPISLGINSNCVVTQNNNVYCSGKNNVGQLARGGGNIVDSPTFVREHTNQTWRSLSPSGYTSMCGVHTNGTSGCWGEVKRDAHTDKTYSILGENYMSTPAFYQTNVTPISGAATDWQFISVGMYTGCGIRATGASCWGMGGDMSTSTPGHNEAFESDVGALGHNTHGNSSFPVTPVMTTVDNDNLGWEMITTGGGCTSCNTASSFYTRPTTCALKKGRAYCWGAGRSGQLGNGAWNNSLIPVQVGSAIDWRYIRTSGTAVCGIRGSGQLFCWGRNGHGQVGAGNSDGGTTTFFPSPADYNTPREVLIGGVAHNDWRFVATGSQVTCGIRGSGLLYCWGKNNNDFMGNAIAPFERPANNAIFPPTQVASHITDWRYVATNPSDDVNHERYGCAVRSTGQYYCWGMNLNGEFGGRNSAGTTTPAVGGTIHPVTEIDIRDPANLGVKLLIKILPL